MYKSVVENKNLCCGCTACYNICPTKAIKMEVDEEGFEYPIIDEDKCIHCQKCRIVCAFKNDLKLNEKNNEVECYAVKHKDNNVVSNSRSGGAFTAFSDVILKSNGSIYGSVLDDNLHVCHKKATDYTGRNKMRGSKYVQSKMDNIFSEVLSDLYDEKKVLFSGTPCQVAGLQKYLSSFNYRGEIFYIDILCHGVPSPMILKKFIELIEKKGKCKKIDFRNKLKYGWKDHVMTFIMDNGREYNRREYVKMFYSHNIIRPSCFNCPYKSIYHPGDITIGDYYGIEKLVPRFNDNKGCSLVLVNTQKGKKLFNKSTYNVSVEMTKLENSLQPVLKGNFELPKSREIFWKDYKKMDFKKLVKKYGKESISIKIKRELRRKGII